MPEVLDAPGEMEEILGRLVAAGVAEPEALAALLGVAPVEIGRPLRALVRVGILSTGGGGPLQVTERGEAWLQLAPSRSERVQSAAELDLPTLEPLPAAASATRSVDAEPTRLKRVWVRVRAVAVPLVRSALARLPPGRLPLGRLPPGRLPRVRLPRPRVPAFAMDRRRLAIAGASVMLVALAGESGLYSLDRARPQPTFAAPIETPSVARATPAPVRAAPTPSPDRWMVVQHTNGLGLVLRPEPASPSRVMLLQDGAQLRVTGESVEKSGHAWLPVASSNGATGWVAGEFLAPLKTANAP